MSARQNGAAEPPCSEVIAWRRQQLVAAGFDASLAAALGSDPCWDLHALLELVERGCPPPLAVRILSPVEKIGASR